MKSSYIAKFSRVVLLAATLAATSCVNDLEVTPIDTTLNTSDKALNTPLAYEQALAKIYSGFVTSGQEGPTGAGDMAGFDEGHSQYWRAFWLAQELPTDEAVNGWSDGLLPQVSRMTWGADNEFIRQFYYRSLYQVSLANEFLRKSDGTSIVPAARLSEMRAEARFLRAFCYWHALDMFGNGIPFTTEKDAIGATAPKPAGSQYGREMYDYLVAELNAIAEQLPARGKANVGQAGKEAAYMLLAKLHLNHTLYAGGKTKQVIAGEYAKADAALAKVFGSSHALVMQSDAQGASSIYSPYQMLFLASNNQPHTAKEMIFSFGVDARYNRSYGAMTYVMNAATGGNIDAKALIGIGGGWGGNRAKPQLVDKFTANDNRAMFFTDGQTKEIADQMVFTNGYAVVKYKNKTVKGENGSNNANDGFVDVDVPVFRLADAYLMAAELKLRQGQSVSGEVLNNINKLRQRAGVPAVTATDVTLDWVLDERARELYWEGHRRTDLRRFNVYTGGAYLWALKGGAPNGSSVDGKYEFMPLPTTDVAANPNLKQNAGY